MRKCAANYARQLRVRSTIAPYLWAKGPPRALFRRYSGFPLMAGLYPSSGVQSDFCAEKCRFLRMSPLWELADGSKLHVRNPSEDLMSINRRGKKVEDPDLNRLLDNVTGLGKASAEQLKKLEEVDLTAPYGTWLGGVYYIKREPQGAWERLINLPESD